MRRFFTSGMKLVVAGLGAAVAVIVTYLAATLAGAAIPAEPSPVSAPLSSHVMPAGQDNASPGRIYLLTTLLHADVAIPVDKGVRTRFAFLRQAGVPMDNPALKYLIFGWGSRAFYTNTPSLADIRPAPTFRAITGDRSVMHVMPANDVSKLPNALAVSLPAGGFDRLLAFIASSFETIGGRFAALNQPGYTANDVFYEARGGFDILKPCNVWVARGLRQAGLATGAWTPTTQSLVLGLSLHSPQALSR